MATLIAIPSSTRHDPGTTGASCATIGDDAVRPHRAARVLRPRLPSMTLRLRLVLALTGLLAVGLALFGFATYSLYARSEYQRLDDQISASVDLVSRQLEADASGHYGPGGSYGPPGTGRPQVNLPPGTYAERRDANGSLENSLQLVKGEARPKLPDTLVAAPGTKRYFTTGSTEGSGQWRVLVAADPGGDGSTVVVAVPMNGVSSALDSLVVTEVLVSIVLLVVLSAGSWLILRRGLHPLEQMAETAGDITAGDLSQRVSPSGGPTEVGQLGLALNTMLDDIEQAFNERDETERRLRQFLADASHELRTPITSIQGFAELFRVGADHAQVDLPTILRRIEEESARMRLLVEDLLLLARLDETRAVEAEPVDLAVLVADACSDAVAADRGRAVTLDAPEPVIVRGDEAHLRQAIANLVSNALAHTPAGTPIEVSARRGLEGAEVRVRDHGPGLDPDAVEHVFDRFWQADSARAGSGSGLGLSIVAGIAGEHGGAAIAANAPGGGAEFTLRLPLEEPGPTPPE
ncbi:MAG TPA: HAMP domain-containing sensor histidine kinase [Acidimicrobiales bacterium]|nr:HAMP domain-containing sensor histidine kinase [Acidimicrobiales bacterium]